MCFRPAIFKILFSGLILASLLGANGHAAVVTFTGQLLTGDPENLGSFPRDFVLTLNYSENLGGNTAAASGTFDILESPPNGQLALPTDGLITITDAPGPGGNDTFLFEGTLPGQTISPANRPVNYSFLFSQPADTINTNFVTVDNVNALVVGATTISLVNNQVDIGGIISGVQKAPEPSTFIALLGLVGVGCGIGYKRRKGASETEPEETEPEGMENALA